MASKDKALVFLVDDDAIYVKALEKYLSEKLSRRAVIKVFETGEACLAAMDENPSIVILDFYLNSKEPDAKDGLTILKQIKKSNEEINVVMLSGQDKIDVAVESMKFGAWDYIVKSEGASIRAEQVIKNILASAHQAQLLQMYKKGFYIVLVIMIAIIIFTVTLYLFFPDLVKYNQ